MIVSFLAGIARTPLADDVGVLANRLRIHPRFHGNGIALSKIENALGTGILDSQQLSRATQFESTILCGKIGIRFAARAVLGDQCVTG